MVDESNKRDFQLRRPGYVSRVKPKINCHFVKLTVLRTLPMSRYILILVVLCD